MKGLDLRPIAARWPVGSALLLLALAGPTMAAATISGTVKVPAGYSLDQATVTASDANNHIVRKEVADDGTYTLDGVVAGTYTLTVQAKGTETPPIQNLVLTDGQTLKQDLTLTAAMRKQITDFGVSIICNYDVMPPTDLQSVTLSQMEAPAQLISLVDMRDIGAWPGWTGYWGVMPFQMTERKGLYGRQLLTGDMVTKALDAAEAGKAPSGEGAKFAPRVGTRRHTGGENYIFADGHARWMMFRRTLNPQTGGTEGSMWMQQLLSQY